MPEDLLLRVQKMDVAGGADRFPQLSAQLYNGAVQVPQPLLVGNLSFFQQEGIVADGLDLQKVIPGGDSAQLTPVLVVQHGPEQLSRRTGTTHNQPLPVGVDEAFGYDGIAGKVLQVGQGDQLVEIAQTSLVFRQQNHVTRPLAALDRRAQLKHRTVDLADALHLQVRQHPPKGHQHIPHHRGVITGPVVVEGRQTQVLRHNVQLVLAQAGQQILGQNQGINGRI